MGPDDLKRMFEECGVPVRFLDVTQGKVPDTIAAARDAETRHAFARVADHMVAKGQEILNERAPRDYRWVGDCVSAKLDSGNQEVVFTIKMQVVRRYK